MSALVDDIVLSWEDAEATYLPGRDPEVGLELLLDDNTYRFSNRAMGGTAFIEGRVVSGGWGQTTRELSDEQGNHAKGRSSAVLNDDDGFFRGLLAGEDSQYFENREASQKLFSRDGRFAGTFRRLFRGRIADIQPSQQVSATRHRRLATITMEDALGPYLDRQIPKHVFTESDFPGIDKRLIGKPIPLIGGEHSDEGVEDANGNSATKGLVPGIHVGPRRTIDDNPTTGVPALLAAPALSVSMVGPAGTTPYSYGVTRLSENGETTISNVVTVYGPAILTSTNFPRLIWDDAGGSIGTVVYGRENTTPVRRLVSLAQGVTTYDDTGIANERAPGPPSFNTAQIPGADGAFFWDFYVVGLGVIPIEHFYGSDVAKQQPPSRINLDETAGVDFLIPGMAGWPHAQLYVQLPSGLQVTGFYGRGPRSFHHITGVVTIALQVCGYEDIGDGSGNSIQEAFPLEQHFLNEFVLKDEGETYRAGNWGPLETYDDTTPILQASRFASCQDLTRFWLGTGEGYRAAIYLSEPITVREFVKLFNQTFGCFSATNHHGQFYPVLIDDSASPEDGRVFRERIEIKRLLDPQIDREQIENPVSFQYDWDPDGQRYRSEVESIYDATANQAQKGQKRNRGTRECPYSRDADTVRDAQMRWHRRMKYARRIQGFVTNYTGTNDEPGDQILIGHRDMIGDGTITLVPHIVLSHSVDPNRDEVTIVAQNISKVLEGVASRSPSGSLSPSASPSFSASVSPTLSPSGSPSASPSTTGSSSSSVSKSVSPSKSPSASISPSASVSPSTSVTGSPSSSVSPSGSVSPSASGSPSKSPSASVSPTVSPSSSVSPSVSPSASVSPSVSKSPSASASPSEGGEEEGMIVLKPSDTTRTATTTPTDDPHLTFPVEANKAYEVLTTLLVVAPNTAADWKFKWNLPAGATLSWGFTGGPSAVDSWSGVSVGSTPPALSDEGDTITAGGSSSGIFPMYFKGTLRIAGTAGDATLQWSQNTSDAGNSTVKADSFINYRDLTA